MYGLEREREREGHREREKGIFHIKHNRGRGLKGMSTTPITTEPQHAGCEVIE
jgi:hypothetical protein